MPRTDGEKRALEWGEYMAGRVNGSLNRITASIERMFENKYLLFECRRDSNGRADPDFLDRMRSDLRDCLENLLATVNTIAVTFSDNDRWLPQSARNNLKKDTVEALRQYARTLVLATGDISESVDQRSLSRVLDRVIYEGWGSEDVLGSRRLSLGQIISVFKQTEGDILDEAVRNRRR